MNFSPAIGTEPNADIDSRTMLKNASRQAAEKGYDDFMIVDADSHHHESDVWSEIFAYMEDPVHRHMANSTKGRFLMRSIGDYSAMTGRIPRRHLLRKETLPPGSNGEVVRTIRWMDAMGVDAACLFPTPMLGLGLHPNVHTEVQLSRAYNKWLTERVLAEEPRIVSMLYLPMNDPAAALKTVEEFGDKKGVVGFMITSTRYKALYENAYMAVYRALEERELPLAFHSATNWADQSMCLTNLWIGAHALGFPWFNMVHLTNWITNGLPERFPRLKLIWIESGLSWIPFLMQRLDQHYMIRTSEVPSLKRLPSDYMREMYFASQPLETINNAEALESTFNMINAETQLLWSSDFPHWDMDLPSVIYDLPFLSRQAKRNILGENARRLFKLEHKLSEPKLARRRAREAAVAAK